MSEKHNGICECRRDGSGNKCRFCDIATAENKDLKQVRLDPKIRRKNYKKKKERKRAREERLKKISERTFKEIVDQLILQTEEEKTMAGKDNIYKYLKMSWNEIEKNEPGIAFNLAKLLVQEIIRDYGGKFFRKAYNQGFITICMGVKNNELCAKKFFPNHINGGMKCPGCGMQRFGLLFEEKGILYLAIFINDKKQLINVDI